MPKDGYITNLTKSYSLRIFLASFKKTTRTRKLS
jgi:hypothetical protein